MDESLLKGKSKNEQISIVWKYLDEMAQNDPEEYSKFIKKTLEDGEKEGLGPPKPCFVVQTQKVPKMIPVRDFFINACEWGQIPPPATNNDPIKMIANDVKEELIKNKMCFTVDVAVNASVMQQCIKNANEKELLIDLMIRYVEETGNCKLNADYKIIDQSYMGNKDNLLDMMCPVSLREAARESTSDFSEEKLIKGLKKMNENANEKDISLKSSHLGQSSLLGQSGSDEVLLPGKMNLKNNAFLTERLVTQNKDGIEKEREQIGNIENKEKDTIIEPEYTRRSEVRSQDRYEVIEINLPGVTKMDDCDLEIGEDFLELLVPNRFRLNVKLDVKVNEDETQAYFVRKNNKLVVLIKS